MKQYLQSKFNLSTRQAGFTLLELLIVIAIISILAAMVLVATGVGRQESQNAKLYQQLKQIENAFILYSADKLTVWPDIFAGPTNTANRVGEFNLQQLISGTPITWEGPKQFPGFGNYLKHLPPDPFSGGYYGYSNLNIPVSTTCPGVAEEGVAIRIAGGNQPDRDSIFLYLDEKIDNSDGALCGKVRKNSGEVVLYIIANNPNDLIAP